jgi:recombination protein RecT
MSNPTWPEIIEHSRQQFELIATKENLVTWAEESQFAIQAINKNTYLAGCNPQSIQDAIINVAAIGLTLNPAYGYAYLVPENVKVGTQRVNLCQLRISFKGLMKIATDSGGIEWVKAEIVKKNDTFTYRGPCEMPIHEMQPFGDRGNTVGVYCIAKTQSGDYLTDIMDLAEINKCKNAAKTKAVWDNWFEEMAKKAIIKRASKQWPLGNGAERFNKAVTVVNDVEGSDLGNEKDITPQVQTITEDQRINLINASKLIGKDENFIMEKLQVTNLLEVPENRYQPAMTWLSNKAKTIEANQ